MDNYQTATFGAGCFWCVEAVFTELRGVVKVVSGYMGGSTQDPTYREICSGTTGHAEVAQITYDPDRIRFKDLLKVFWSSHDPTTLNQQGHDRGTQYRSVIFYHDELQKEIAERSKNQEAVMIWDNPIVTEITKVSMFYPAEAYHQDYYASNPNNGYCRAVINPKLSKFRKEFINMLKESPRHEIESTK